MASWPVPGFVCSHFDDFLARAFELRGWPFRAIHSPDEHAPAAEAGSPLIVHLRGSIREADRAAWGGFAVRWIEEAPEGVVAEITRRVGPREVRRC